MMKLYERVTIIPRQLIKDDRGWFLKVINGTENELPHRTGEIYFTSATSGQSKGGHYHVCAKEWFTLINGKALLQLQDVETKERMDIELDAAFPVTVFIPQLVAHNIINLYEDDFVLCAYTDVLYDPKDTISYQI